MYALARKIASILPLLLMVISALLSATASSSAQTTIATGSIVGVVSDPSGAVIAGARIDIANLATGQVIEVITNSGGLFQSGALIPGNYKAVVSANSFGSVEAEVKVLVGNVSTLNVKLQLGQGKEVIEVQGSEIKVNTEQAMVQGVLNAE